MAKYQLRVVRDNYFRWWYVEVFLKYVFTNTVLFLFSTSRIQWTHHSVFEQRSDAALVQGARWNAHTIDSSASAHHSGGCVLAHYLRMLQPQVGLINHSISPLMSLRLPAAQIYFVALLTTILISPTLFFHYLDIDSVILNMTNTMTNHQWYHCISFVFIAATSQGGIRMHLFKKFEHHCYYFIAQFQIINTGVDQARWEERHVSP